MKDYQRQYPSFSLCGLFCGLCPIHHMENGCPGCGGGDGHQPCAVIRCGREHGGPEFCCDCPAYPCERYLEPPLYEAPALPERPPGPGQAEGGGPARLPRGARRKDRHPAGTAGAL
ncbi:MAG: DUF3795 domain-containing protein [Anaerotruncus massiliensis (ex Togo et al. 2019)]